MASKRELPDPEQVEAKKQKKKEQAVAFFEQQKRKKEAEKKERAEALARGEAAPEKPAPAPLREPPALAPQVRAFAAAAVDPGVTSESLALIFRRILATRHEVASVSAEIAGNEECGTHQMRRKALLRCLVDRLRCLDSQTLPLGTLSADPAITVLRKNIAKSVHSFASSFPDSFQVQEEANAKGKMQWIVRLIGSGPAGTSAVATGGALEAELLAGQIASTLQAAGGAATVRALTQDPAVRQRMQGVASKLPKFLAGRADVFELVQMADGDFACSLKADAQGYGGAGAASDPRDLLLQTITAFLQQRGGAATVSDLGKDPTIQERMRGVAAKLTKFLAQSPDRFWVQPEGEKQQLVCRLQEAS